LKEANLKSDGFAKPTFIMLIATVLAGGLGYLYQILMGRYLGTSIYGELSAILSIFLIVSIPTQTVSTMLIRYVSKLKAEGKGPEMAWLVRITILYVTILAAVTALAVFIAIPFLDSYLKLSSDTSLYILIAGLFISILYPIGIGTAQGLQRFGIVSIANVVGPLGKLIFSLIFVLMGFSVAGAFGGVVIGSVLALMISFYSIKDIFQGKRQKFDTAELRRYLVPVTIAVLCFTVLTNVDTFLARHYLSDVDSSIYSAASMISKIILFLPGAIGAVMFPRISEAHAKGIGTYPIMRKSIIWTLAISGVAAAVFLVIPDSVIGILYTSDYQSAGPSLSVLGVAMVLFGLATLFMNFGLATDSNAFITIMAVFTVLEIGLIAVWNTTPLEIAIDLLVSSIGLCAFSWAHLEIRRRSGLIR
jgi:O-antigen/teichoic acid export membrane protein